MDNLLFSKIFVGQYGTSGGISNQSQRSDTYLEYFTQTPIDRSILCPCVIFCEKLKTLQTQYLAILTYFTIQCSPFEYEYLIINSLNFYHIFLKI